MNAISEYCENHVRVKNVIRRFSKNKDTTKNTVFAYYLVGKGTLDEHVAEILTDKEFEIDSILDKQGESFENKEKAKMILAQIHDKLGTKL